MPAVVGLGVAAEQCLEARDYMCTEVARLQMFFEKSLKSRLPQTKLLFEEEERIPGILTAAFPGIINETLLFSLNQRGVLASIGGGSQQLLSYYLKTCGIDPLIADTALSFSLSRETTEEEIEFTINALEAAVHQLQKTSHQLFRK